MEILTAVALLIGLGAFVAAPMVRRSPPVEPGQNLKLENLLDRKEEIYAAIKDVEYDFHMAKVSEIDYQQMKNKLYDEAGRVLAELDRLQSRADLGVQPDLDADLETEIAIAKARRAKASRAGRAGKAGHIHRCARCGHSNAAANKFCGNCGAQIP
ncbi:MAG: zinc ribbon domain-containing protein [Acidobacteria bacterium]|nr:zinc ribbon domain-containing protein [Acidobacteriota bacterium]